METGFVCPSRQILAMACASSAGFHEESNKTKRQAPTRFNPVPPALVDKRRIFPDLLKTRTMSDRALGGVDPCNRAKSMPISEHNSATKSSVVVKPETMTMRSSSGSARNMRLSTLNLLEESTNDAVSSRASAAAAPRRVVLHSFCKF